MEETGGRGVLSTLGLEGGSGCDACLLSAPATFPRSPEMSRQVQLKLAPTFMRCYLCLSCSVLSSPDSAAQQMTSTSPPTQIPVLFFLIFLALGWEDFTVSIALHM